MSDRADAARCFTAQSDDRGVNLFDPCFRTNADAESRVNEFLCPEDPWNDKARRTLVIGPTAEATVGEVPSSPRPWALELTNAQRCFAVSGATGTTGGLRQNYQCFAPPFTDNPRRRLGTPGGVVLGDPDQGARMWSANFTKRPSDTTVTVVGVRRAYE